MNDRLAGGCGSGTNADRGLSLTLGVSLLLHAAALGTVAVFAAQPGEGWKADARPPLEVVWVADVRLENVPAATRAVQDVDESPAFPPRSVDPLPTRPIVNISDAQMRRLGDAENGAASRSPEATIEATVPASEPLIAEQTIVAGVLVPLAVPEPEAAPGPGVAGPEPERASEGGAAAQAELPVENDWGWSAAGSADPHAPGSDGEVGDPSADPPSLRLSRPEYPPISRRLGEEGTVLLAMRFGPDGLVSEARVERSSGFARLDWAALAAARAERLNRAALNTQPEVFLKVAYTFTLEDR